VNVGQRVAPALFPPFFLFFPPFPLHFPLFHSFFIPFTLFLLLFYSFLPLFLCFLSIYNNHIEPWLSSFCTNYLLSTFWTFCIFNPVRFNIPHLSVQSLI
jgi:hypothetical protein